MNKTMFKLVFGQALNYSRCKHGVWGTYVAFGLIALLMTLIALAMIITGFSRNLMIIELALVATLVAVVWGATTKIVPLLVTPGNAKLVPGLRRGVMSVIVTNWAVVVLFFALAIGYLFGNFARYGAMAAIMLGGLALMSIGRLEGLVPYILGMFVAMERLGFAGITKVTSTTVLVLIGLLASTYAFFHLFPSGDRHWRSTEKFDNAMKKLSGQAPYIDARRIGPWRWVHGKVLAHDCRSGKASSGQLLWHALGPSAHWSSPLIICLLVQSCMVLGLWLLPMVGLSVDFWKGFMIGIGATAVVFGQFAQMQSVAVRMHATRAEQELVRLTPRIPQNKALNAVFVKHVLWQSVGLFCLVLLMTLFISMVVGETPARTLTRLFQVSLSVLASASMLRLITRTSSPVNVWPAVVILLQMLGVGIVFALAYPLIVASFEHPWAVLALVSLVLAGVLLRHDINRVLRGPTILPLAKA
jgi:hypothetical protein